MYVELDLACRMLLSMNACEIHGLSLLAQDKSTQVAQQAAEPVSQIQQLRMQAERGNAEAQFASAKEYDHGRNVQKDKIEGVRRHRPAAMQGGAFAQNTLGDNY
jgi:TPR repeat protein